MKAKGKAGIPGIRLGYARPIPYPTQNSKIIETNANKEPRMPMLAENYDPEINNLQIVMMQFSIQANQN